MELIIQKENLNKTYLQVKRNKGTGGIDGMQVDELLLYLREHQSELIQQLREGVSLGGPLSPLIGNVMLNKLDKELKKRGDKFVRYVNGCMILCRSRKSAQRTLEHIVPYIEGKLYLGVCENL